MVLLIQNLYLLAIFEKSSWKPYSLYSNILWKQKTFR